MKGAVLFRDITNDYDSYSELRGVYCLRVEDGYLLRYYKGEYLFRFFWGKIFTQILPGEMFIQILVGKPLGWGEEGWRGTAVQCQAHMACVRDWFWGLWWASHIFDYMFFQRLRAWEFRELCIVCPSQILIPLSSNTNYLSFPIDVSMSRIPSALPGLPNPNKTLRT